MKIRNLTAAMVAAAVLAVAAPITGTLPAVGIVASAEELKEGDIFYAGINEEGNFNDILAFELGEWDYPETKGVDAFECQVKSDGTIKVSYYVLPATFNKLRGKTLTIPGSINGYAVSELGMMFSSSGCKKVVIPDTVKVIDKGAFMYGNFEEVEFVGDPQLELIDEQAFQDCRYLKTITIPASVETIGLAAFANTPQFGNDPNSLTSVNFAEGSKLKVIGEWAFQLQKSLETIELPDSLEKIADSAFLGCSALKKVEIPENVNEIGTSVFANADENDKQMSISEINVAEKNKNYKSVDGVVFTKDGTTIVEYPAAKSGKQYEIPEGVNTIADSAFSDCIELTSVTIPESVSTIEEDAFSGSSLTNINGEPGSYAETYANENGYTFNAAASDKEDEPDDTSKPEEDSDTSKPDDTSKPEKSDDTSKPEATEERFWYHRDLDMEDVEVGGTFPLDVEVDAKLDESSTDKRMVYDIRLIRDGKDYEPDGTVAVRIRVPDSMSDIADNLKVYHLKDGKYTNMNAESDQRGWLEFNTDHFSVYVLTAEELENADGSDSTSTPDKSEPDKGSPDTGVPAAAAAVGVLAIAGAVVMISRKKR